jgi:hypothetical protein
MRKVWTEEAQVKLVEAVTTVERDLMQKGLKVTRGERWDAVASLLPSRLRLRTWNSDRKSYNFPVCYSMFNYLAKAYRHKVEGIFHPRTLTEPVRRAFRSIPFRLDQRKMTMATSSLPQIRAPTRI